MGSKLLEIECYSKCLQVWGFPPGSWNKGIAFKKSGEDTGCLKGLIAIMV